MPTAIAHEQIVPEHSLVLLRVGLHGQVGRFQSDEVGALRRMDRTVCRTARGLEVGVVLGVVERNHDEQLSVDGKILRRTTPEDELLWGHLQQLGEEAFQSCNDWLKSAGAAALLLEVEPLLDGRTLYFHFLSAVDEEIQSRLDELVAIYEQKVRQSKFANLLTNGCGPGCGTSQAKHGCGSKGGCAVCKVASACSKPTDKSIT